MLVYIGQQRWKKKVNPIVFQIWAAISENVEPDSYHK